MRKRLIFKLFQLADYKPPPHPISTSHSKQSAVLVVRCWGSETCQVLDSSIISTLSIANALMEQLAYNVKGRSRDIQS